MVVLAVMALLPSSGMSSSAPRFGDRMPHGGGGGRSNSGVGGGRPLEPYHGASGRGAERYAPAGQPPMAPMHGDVADFVAEVTRVVQRGARAFAILDSDKYLPLTDDKDCPRPRGLSVRRGQWLSVQARHNTNSGNNPWTCTRVYCEVSAPQDERRYPPAKAHPVPMLHAGVKRGASEMMPPDGPVGGGHQFHGGGWAHDDGRHGEHPQGPVARPNGGLATAAAVATALGSSSSSGSGDGSGGVTSGGGRGAAQDTAAGGSGGASFWQQQQHQQQHQQQQQQQLEHPSELSQRPAHQHQQHQHQPPPHHQTQQQQQQQGSYDPSQRYYAGNGPPPPGHSMQHGGGAQWAGGGGWMMGRPGPDQFVPSQYFVNSRLPGARDPRYPPPHSDIEPSTPQHTPGPPQYHRSLPPLPSQHQMGASYQRAPTPAGGADIGAPSRLPPSQQGPPHPGHFARPTPPVGPAELAAELRKVKKIRWLLEFLDGSLRSHGWPSASVDAAAALFKMANLAIADSFSAGKHIIQWDKSHGLLGHLLQVVRQDVMSLTPMAISQCLWAMGKSLLFLATSKGHKVGVDAMQQTLDALATELVARGHQGLEAQVLSMSLYGVAKAGYASPRLQLVFDMAERHITAASMNNYTAQHVANVAWSFAFFRRPGAGIMREVEAQLRSRNLSDFKTGELSMMLWACAKYQYEGTDATPHMYSLVASEYKRRGINGCSAQELANLAWALTAPPTNPREPHPYAEVILEIAQACVTRKLVWKSANEMRNILSCVRKARVSDAGLCAEVAAELAAKANRSGKGEVGTLRSWVLAFWLFAQLGFEPPAALVAVFQRKLESGTLVYSDGAYVSKAHYSAAKFAVVSAKVGDRLDMIRNRSVELRPALVPSADDAAVVQCSAREHAEDEIELLWSLAVMGRVGGATAAAADTVAVAAAVVGELTVRHLLLLEWALGALGVTGSEVDGFNGVEEALEGTEKRKAAGGASARQEAGGAEEGPRVTEQVDAAAADEIKQVTVAKDLVVEVHKAAAAKVLALESASQLQDAAAVLCVSRAGVGGGGGEGLPRSVGQQLRGTEMAGFWSWLRSDQPKGRGAASKKKSVDRLQSFVDALE